MKPSRRRKGATLGLVAACVLVIIVLGIGVFFLAKLFGGGREVANATDAGTLNLAKNALIQPAVQLPLPVAGSVTPGSEFYGCAYPPPTDITKPATIDLFTYNRCVGQALLIALNAKAESDAGSSGAMLKAKQVLQDLQAIGQTLVVGLNGPGTGPLPFDTARPAGILATNFFTGANKNNVNMFGDTKVNQSGLYQTAYMKAGGATNVFFSTPVLNLNDGTLPTQTQMQATSTNTPDPNNLSSAPGKFYLQGYNGITVSAGGQNLVFYGVPVFPQQKPHLVSLDDFKQSGTSVDTTGSTPPNSFRVDSSAVDTGKTNNIGGAIACAIVGAAMQNNTAALPGSTFSPDFPVSIPTGYIELVNPGGNNLPQNFLPADNQTNIFNNELFDGAGGGLPGGAYGSGGLTTGNTTDGTGVFGDGPSIAAWAAYNNSVGVKPPSGPDVWNATTNPGGTPANPKVAAKYPPSLTPAFDTPPSSKIFDSTGNPAGASLPTCLSITGGLDNCTQDNAPTGPGLSGKCASFLNGTPSPFQNAYSHGMPTTGPGSPLGGASAADTLKGIIMANFNGAGYHKQIDIAANQGSIDPATGLGNGNFNVSTGIGSTMKTSTGLGEFMGPNGMLDVYSTPNPVLNGPTNQFPIQNTGQLVAGQKPSILGLLAQLDNKNGPAGQSQAPNYNFTQCGGVFNSILQRVQQIQPSYTAQDLQTLLNGPIESSAGPLSSLPMGKTAYIFLDKANVQTKLASKGIRIYAENTGTLPSALPFYTATNPDGLPGTSNSGGTGQCQQKIDAMYNSGYGIVDVSIDGANSEGFNINNKGDDHLHQQPYEAVNPMSGGPNSPSGQPAEYGETDTGKWTPSSGYGNMLGRLNFSDVVSGSASFSSPN